MSLVRDYIKENFLEEVITYKVKKGKEEEFIEFLDENGIKKSIGQLRLFGITKPQSFYQQYIYKKRK